LTLAALCEIMAVLYSGLALEFLHGCGSENELIPKQQQQQQHCNNGQEQLRGSSALL
jgi:hypothetical protein